MAILSSPITPCFPWVLSLCGAEDLRFDIKTEGLMLYLVWCSWKVCTVSPTFSADMHDLHASPSFLPDAD